MRIDITGLGHRFESSNWLFQNLNATLVAGEVYALTGPSGSGKSTLLSIIAGWEKPVAGDITKHGIKRTGWVFQNPHGMPRRSALDHVVFPLLAAGVQITEAQEQAAEILKQFRLEHVQDRAFRELSGGEAQRLMLARGIAARPQLFLVDEPTAQLDISTAAEVNAVLQELGKSDTIVVIATHDAQTRDACSAHIDLQDYQKADMTL